MEKQVIVGNFIFLIALVDCSKILLIVSTWSQSHYNVFVPIIEELANRNHEITVQANHTLKRPLPNVKELQFTPNRETDKTTLSKEFFIASLKLGPVQLIREEIDGKQLCLGYLTDDTTKTLLAAGMKYDVVIIDALFSYCPLAVASLVGNHIIELYTTAFFAWGANAPPIPPSYVPLNTDLMPSKMNFFQRFKNVLNTIGVLYVNEYEIKAAQQDVLSKILPHARPINEIEKDIAFSITNGDSVVTSPRPNLPNIADCGGMHLRKPNVLPKDLNEFAESSGSDGFIIFGLGSNMKSEYVSQEEVDTILSAFSRLKQKVIWKYESLLQNLPKNVKITKWLPQQDLLGHPNCRLFITHAGLLSLQEAIYHGVPVIGMPFFADQRGNTMRMKELGIGEHFDFLNITADGFYEIITQVLNDKSYYENMKKCSSIIRDQPERPVDRAVFWIEYVIRHNGARHLRSAGEHLNFYQYFLLDVIAFTLLAAIASLIIVIYLVKLGFSIFTATHQSKNKLKRK